MQPLPLRARWPAYAAALLLASGSEALLAALLGGTHAIDDALRAVAAGLLLAGLIEALFALARRVEPRFAGLLGVALGAGLLLLPGPLRLFETIALRPAPPPLAGSRPAVTVLTGLPVMWGEGGVGAALAGPPSLAYRRLAAEFRLRPIDIATPRTLANAPVLLAAQPFALAPAEVSAIDRWVRMGGRALLLVDPDLRWPSELPPGDPRRPPRTATLAPLLARWGVGVARGGGRIVTIDIATAGGPRRIVSDAPGWLRMGPGCRPVAGGRAAACRIGRGRVLVLADADVLDDRLWAGVGGDGGDRLTRLGDNLPLVADWLDALADSGRNRADDSVSWMPRDVSPWVFVGAALPALAIGLCGLVCGIILSSHRLRRTKHAPHGYPQERNGKDGGKPGV